MKLNFGRGLLLRSFCVWTAFVWLVLVKNMVADNEHGLAFRLVHIGLAAVSLTFAALVWPSARKLDAVRSKKS